MKINHIMPISKVFNGFMCNKTKDNNKKHFSRYCLWCFTSKRVLIEYKEHCLIVNLKLRSRSIKFKIYFKQSAVPSKIYVDFECVLKRVKSNNKNNNT